MSWPLRPQENIQALTWRSDPNHFAPRILAQPALRLSAMSMLDTSEVGEILARRPLRAALPITVNAGRRVSDRMCRRPAYAGAAQLGTQVQTPMLT
jgi:hypothetical protein